MFNEDDIPRCNHEVFTVENIATEPIGKDLILLRNGDYISISKTIQKGEPWGEEYVGEIYREDIWGFLLTQYQHVDSDVPYSEVPNQNTGTMEKIPPKLLAMCTFLTVLLAIN